MAKVSTNYLLNVKESMEDLIKLWKNENYEVKTTETTYIMTKKFDLFERCVKINFEEKRILVYNRTGGSYFNTLPLWIDEKLLKLIRKSARILKWKF